MPLQSEYTDLVTPSQVADLSMAKLGKEIEGALRATPGSGDTQEIQQAVLHLIKGTSRQINEALNRELIVAQHTDYFNPDEDWIEAPEYQLPDDESKWRAFFSNYPALHVYSVDADTDLADEVTVMGEDQDIAATDLEGDLTQLPTRINFFAGFKRFDFDQPGSGGSWNDIFSTTTLTDLPETVEVPNLPMDICEVCATIVIAKLRWQYKGLIGVISTSMTADRLNITSQKQVDGFVETQLASIMHHRKPPY
jgi:hypothetical protein